MKNKRREKRRKNEKEKGKKKELKKRERERIRRGIEYHLKIPFVLSITSCMLVWYQYSACEIVFIHN